MVQLVRPCLCLSPDGQSKGRINRTHNRKNNMSTETLLASLPDSARAAAQRALFGPTNHTPPPAENASEGNVAPKKTAPAGEMVPLRGNTYPVKEQLKALGAKWNKEDGCWRVPSARLAEAEAIVKAGSTGSSPDLGAGPTYAKLPDGSWGVRIPGTARPAMGASVTVKTRAGKAKTETVAAVLSYKDGVAICAVVPRQKRRSSGRDQGWRGNGCPIWRSRRRTSGHLSTSESTK